MEDGKILIDEDTGKRYKVNLEEITDNVIQFPKVGIVIGHYEGGKGFMSHMLGLEWSYWRDFTEQHLGGLCNMLMHDANITSYTKRQEAMAKVTKDYDLVFELHFNAHNEHAEGAHAMYYAKSTAGKFVADLFTEYMLHTYGIEKDWNRPVDNANVRGGAFIMKQKCTSVLLEPFFADNESDVQKFLSEDPSRFISILRNLILAFYEETKKA